VALALVDRGARLLVANQHSGSLSILETAGPRLAVELPVGRRLTDLAATADGNTLVVTDEQANEIVLLSRHQSTWEVSGRLAVSPSPVSVHLLPDGSHCTIVSLWSRRVTLVELAPRPRVVRTISLPFPPRGQLLLPGGQKLLVADAFGGRLAVVDIQRGAVDSVRSVPGHNIRGLALSRNGEQVLLAHQMANGLSRTTYDDVHWGNMLTNNIRTLEVADLLKPKADILYESTVRYFGEVGNAAGDPAGLAAAPDGKLIVALAGVGDVALGREESWEWQRLPVGRRPTAVCLTPDGRRAYVANTFADSVSVVDLTAGKVEQTVSLGRSAPPSLVERGEQLFYDARLAHDGWFSCHSCHTDGHTNGLLTDNLGDGSFGAPKRVLSLLGVKDTAPWAWNGSITRLEDQVRKSVATTMHGPKLSDEQVEALLAYLRTLPPPPPLVHEADHAAVQRGREVFENRSCVNCHAPPTYTTPRTYNVGLTDEVGNTTFNPPSLRGVGQGGPYFHDNRAKTLEEVFTRHRHQLKAELSAGELRDLLTFLRSL
jgi:YVTN family beta-propeller protein